jgi:hypothetical protein
VHADNARPRTAKLTLAFIKQNVMKGFQYHIDSSIYVLPELYLNDVEESDFQD